MKLAEAPYNDAPMHYHCFPADSRNLVSIHEFILALFAHTYKVTVLWKEHNRFGLVEGDTMHLLSKILQPAHRHLESSDWPVKFSY